LHARSSSRAIARSSPASAPCGTSGRSALEAVQGDHAGDAGVLGVVLLLRRPTPTGDEVRVHGHHHVAGVEQSLDQQPVARLDHDPHLCRVGLQAPDAVDQGLDGLRPMLDPDHLHDPVFGAAQGHQMKLLRPVNPYSEHASSSRLRGEADVAFREVVETRRRADGPVLEGRHPCWRQASEAVLPGRRLISVLEGQAMQAFPEGDLCVGW
jgi:hypothetical protein